jgi:hypothetical protein
MSKTTIEILGLGLFEPYFTDSGELFYYFQIIEFRNSKPELVVYPKRERPPKPKVMKELGARFLRFTEMVDVAMNSFPKLLRDECANYCIDTGKISDEQMVANLDWTNINLDPSGTIECYAKNLIVSCNFDISFGFTGEVELYRLQFDG